jgi:hypothetical protein
MTGLEGGVAAVLAAAVIAGAGSPDAGRKEVEPLVRRSKAAVKAIEDTRVELVKTMEAHDALMSEIGTDRRGAYKKLQRQIARTQARRAELLFRSAEMEAEAAVLFRKWSASATAGDAEQRWRGQERLAAAWALQADVKAAGEHAADLYDQVMVALAEQMVHLERNLTLWGVADLRPEGARLHGQVRKLVARIDDTIGATNRAIAALGPP